MKREALAGVALGLLLAGCGHGAGSPAPTLSPQPAHTSPPTMRPTTASPASPTPSHHPSTSSTPALGVGSGFTCRDGTISHAAHRQGACSHHGGIA